MCVWGGGVEGEGGGKGERVRGMEEGVRAPAAKLLWSVKRFHRLAGCGKSRRLGWQSMRQGVPL